MADNITPVGVRLLVEREAQFLAAMQRAQRAINNLLGISGRGVSVKFDVASRNAIAELNSVGRAIADLNGRTINVAVDVASQAARDELGRVESQVRGLDGARATVTVDSAVSAALDGLQRVLAGVRGIDGARASVNVSASITGALEALGRIEGIVRNLDASASVAVAADVRAALEALGRVEAALVALNGQKATVEVAADVTSALNDLGAIESLLVGLNGKKATVEVDASTTSAVNDLGAIESLLVGLNGKKAIVGVDASTTSATTALGEVTKALGDVPARKTISVDADIRSATSALESAVALAANAGADAGQFFADSFSGRVRTGFDFSIGNDLYNAVKGAFGAVASPIGDAFDFENVVADTAAVVSAGTERVDPAEAQRRIEQLIQRVATDPGLLAADDTTAAALQALIRGGTTIGQAEGGALQAAIQFQNLAGRTGSVQEFELAGETLSAIRAINNLDVSELDRVAQVSTAVLGQSKISDINDLSYGFLNMASAIAASNLSLEEQGALLIQTANGFKSTRTQATAISALYSELRSPTEQQAAAQKALGIRYRDSNGEIIDTIELQRQLRAAYNDTGRSAAEIDQLIGEAFGTTALDAITQLVQGQDIQKILDDIQGVSVPIALDIRTSTSQRIFENLGGIIQSDFRQVFSESVEALRPVAVSLAELFQTIQPQFENLGTVLSAVLQPFNDQIVAAVERVNALAESGAPLLEVFGALTNEALTFADTVGGAVISALSLAFGGNYQVDTLSQAFRDVRDYINEWLTPAREFFTTISQIAEAVGGVIESFQTGGLFGEGGLIGSFLGGGGLFGEGGIGSLLSGLGENNFVKEAIKLQLQALLLPVEDVEQLFSTLSGAFTAFRDAIAAAADPIGSALSAIYEKISSFLARLAQQAGTVQGKVAEFTRDLASRSGLGTVVRQTTSPAALNAITGADDIAAAQAAGINTNQRGTARISSTTNGVEFTSSPVSAALGGLPGKIGELINKISVLVVQNGGVIGSPLGALAGGALAQQQVPPPAPVAPQPEIPAGFANGQVLDVNVVNQGDEALTGQNYIDSFLAKYLPVYGQPVQGAEEAAFPTGFDVGTVAEQFQTSFIDPLTSSILEQQAVQAAANEQAIADKAAQTEAEIAQAKAVEEQALASAQAKAEAEAAQTEAEAAASAAQVEQQTLVTESLATIPEPANLAAQALAPIPEPATATATALSLLPGPAGATVAALGGLAGALNVAIAQIRAAVAGVAAAAAAARSAGNSNSGNTGGNQGQVVPGQTRATGGPVRGTALVGELGRELFYSAAGQAGIVGANGPEIVNFTSPSTVIPADQTASILGRGVRSVADGAGTPTLGSIFGGFTDFFRGLTGSATRVKRAAEETADMAADAVQLTEDTAEVAELRYDAEQTALRGVQDVASSQLSVAQAVAATTAQINDVLGRTSVTAEDLEATAAGTYTDKVDEFVRRLAAAANDGSFGETLEQAATALEAAGFTPETDPKALYAQFTKAWDDRTLFYAEENLKLINTAAITEQGQAAQAAAEAQAALDEKAAVGVANLSAYLGQFVDSSVAGIASSLGVDTGDAGATQAGAGSDSASGASSGINEAISALSGALSSLASLVSDSVNVAMSGLYERTNGTLEPLSSMASALGTAASRVKSFSDAAESAIEEIRTLLRGSADGSNAPANDPVAQAGAQALGGIAHSGRTLVGEGGQEIWYNAAARQAGVVGTNGPEFVDFAAGTRVFTAAESAAILARSGGSSRPIYRSALLGIDFDPGPGGGRSSSSSSSGGGLGSVLQQVEDALAPLLSGSGISVPSSSSSTTSRSLDSVFRERASGLGLGGGSLGASIGRESSNRSNLGIAVSGRNGQVASVFAGSQAAASNAVSPILVRTQAASPAQSSSQVADIARQFTARFRGSVSPSQTRIVNNYNISNVTTVNSNNTTDYGGLNVQSLRSTESISGDFRQFKTLYG